MLINYLVYFNDKYLIFHKISENSTFQIIGKSIHAGYLQVAAIWILLPAAGQANPKIYIASVEGCK